LERYRLMRKRREREKEEWQGNEWEMRLSNDGFFR
jgi:hypothetical protein